MEMLRSEKTTVTPERVSAVAFGFLTTMVDGMILSAVRRECIQSAQLLEWAFPSPFQACVISAHAQVSRGPGGRPWTWKAKAGAGR